MIKQLNVSGKLICPVGNEKNQNLVLIEKKEKKEIIRKVLDPVLFVPMLPGIVNEDKVKK